MSEGQGDFMGDNLGSDPDYLLEEAKSDLRRGLITSVQFDRKMERIQRIEERNEERDYDCEY